MFHQNTRGITGRLEDVKIRRKKPQNSVIGWNIFIPAKQSQTETKINKNDV